jgi:hypothetical protein
MALQSIDVVSHEIARGMPVDKYRLGLSHLWIRATGLDCSRWIVTSSFLQQSNHSPARTNELVRVMSRVSLHLMLTYGTMDVGRQISMLFRLLEKRPSVTLV